MSLPFLTRAVNMNLQSADVNVGRPGPYGSRFTHRRDIWRKWGDMALVHSREEAILCYEFWLLDQPDLIDRACRELTGMSLGCWCLPLPCHAQVLVKIVEARLARSCAEGSDRC
jgi:hypothetical protein